MSTAQGRRIKCKMFTVKEDLFQEMRRLCVCVVGGRAAEWQVSGYKAEGPQGIKS